MFIGGITGSSMYCPNVIKCEREAVRCKRNAQGFLSSGFTLQLVIFNMSHYVGGDVVCVSGATETMKHAILWSSE